MPNLHEIAAEHRQTDPRVLADISHSWSPRTMTGETLTREDLEPLFQAARCAPSCFNNQPWRFHYALRSSPRFRDLFNLLVPKNQQWCENAGCLMILVAKTTFDHNGKPMPTAAHDTGAAWHALAIEGTRRDLVTHGMAGFDLEAATRYLNLGSEYAVQCMIAVGKPAPGVAEEALTQRRPVEEIAIEL